MSPVSLPPNFFVVARLFHLPSSASLWLLRQLKHLYTFLTPFQDSLFEPSALLFPLSAFSPRISAKRHTKEKKKEKIVTLFIKILTTIHLSDLYLNFITEIFCSAFIHV